MFGESQGWGPKDGGYTGPDDGTDGIGGYIGGALRTGGYTAETAVGYSGERGI